MENLRAIRTRIASLRKTAQITRAMKMVSAVKLRRIQIRLVDSGPYVAAAAAIMRRLARQPSAPTTAAHWLTPPPRGARRILLAVISADRGLCGNLNLNVLRRAQDFLRNILADPQMMAELLLVGRKGADFFRSRLAEYGGRAAIIRAMDAAGADPAELCRQLTDAYRQGEYGRVHVIYTRFESALHYHTAEWPLLPLHFDAPAADAAPASEDLLVEPDAARILDYLAPRYLQSCVRRVLLSSIVAEHSSRMSIMEQAHKKTEDIIRQQRLFFNKARQLGIDRELADITAGAEASA